MTQRWTMFFAMAVLVASLACNSTDDTGAENQPEISNFQTTLELAEQGDLQAQLIVGGFYATGKGVPEDDSEAVRWFRLAAEQGNLSAYYSLAFSYSNGNGVPQDDVFAHMWANLAAAGLPADHWLGRMAVALRDEAASRLTPDQRAEALRLAREWNEAHPQ
jgi:TPR repeat protein